MAIKSNSNYLREQLFAVLRESTTSAAEDLKALSQCAAHIRNRIAVENIARESDLTLAGFLTNNALELFYNIKRGRHHLGYISKGWEDPGFRIGELVEIGWWDADVLKATTPQIMRCCATNGITMTIQEGPLTMTLQLDGVIYSEGFNRDTFLQTLDSLNACVEKIHALIPGHDQDRPSAYAYGRLVDTCGRLH